MNRYAREQDLHEAQCDENVHLHRNRSGCITTTIMEKEQQNDDHEIYLSVISHKLNPLNQTCTRIMAGMAFDSLDLAEHFALNLLKQVERARDQQPVDVTQIMKATGQSAAACCPNVATKRSDDKKKKKKRERPTKLLRSETKKRKIMD